MATDQIGAPIYLGCAMPYRHLLPNAVRSYSPGYAVESQTGGGSAQMVDVDQ